MKRFVGWIFIGFAVLVAVGTVGSFFTDDPAEDVPKDVATTLCELAFESHAKAKGKKFTADAVVESSGDVWVVRIPGELQSADGAWQKVWAHCRCLKKTPERNNLYSSKVLVEFKIISRP